ncbi:sepiapterin reductase-like [Tubulanus polymorphus]|uniref:sepiapterin reductase-like n=1 Tax=Tubulanus polymorphus TaxID=672921 RepID=UPI003DA6A820
MASCGLKNGLKTLVAVTGASKGLGRAIALCLTEKIGAGSHVLLLARNRDGLEQTKAEIKGLPPGGVTVAGINLGSADGGELRAVFDGVLESDGADSYEQAILIHNAASLGDITKHAREFNDSSELQSYWSLNLTSCIVLNSIFLEKFSKSTVSRRIIVNISSSSAVQPYKSWSLYCTGKAAREMFFRTLAAEDSSLRVLNYAPGPLDTDMHKQARCDSADNDLKQGFNDMFEKGGLLSPMDSARRLVLVLERDTFETGDHVDYYNVSDTN